MNAAQHLIEVLKLADQYNEGVWTSGELFGKVAEISSAHPAERSDVLDCLAQNPNQSVRGVADDIRAMIRQQEEQVKDIDEIRKTSPLQPGVKLLIGGGYKASYEEPWWLNGREYYKGTFIQFVKRGAGKMPAAFVELENEIDMAEGTGYHHKGRYALMKLRYVDNWDETQTVEIDIVETLPSDVEAFYSSHAFGTEIESHAEYRIVK